jgi:uncharacterized membrane protein
MTSHGNKLRSSLTFISGLGVGAGLAYLLDPDRGARRRALVRDKLTRAARRQGEVFEKGARDLSHRTSGLVARVSGSARRREDVDDAVLVERVRAKLGRYVSHPGSIDIEAHEGRITVKGPIFADEIDAALHAIRRVPGVQSVESDLEPHETAENVPGLQGAARPQPRSLPLRDNWPPAIRVLATAGGASLGLYGLIRGGFGGGVAAVTGGALLLRGTTNKPVRQLTGIGAGHRAVDLQKTITVGVPIEELFHFWSKFDNFPRFMEHVKSVELMPETGRSRWKVSGPGGITTAWDAEVSSMVPNERLAWHTVGTSSVEHAGTIRFEKVDEGSTRLHIQMSYKPPAGALGHVVASLFGKDPKRALNDDLLRMKSMLEVGKATAHGETVTMEQLQS